MEVNPRSLFPAVNAPAAERSGSSPVVAPSDEEALAALSEVWKEGGRFLVDDATLAGEGGAPVSNGGGAVQPSPPAGHEVAPQEFLAAVRTPGALCTLVLGTDHASLPVSGVEDLAALTTLYAAGAPAVAAGAHLLGALRSMRCAGVRFSAMDSKAVDERGRPARQRVEVGAYGAWKALQETASSARFRDVSIEAAGEKARTVEGAEEVAAWAFFRTHGPAEALGHPRAALALRDLEGAGAVFFQDDSSFSSKTTSAMECYLGLVDGSKDRAWLGCGTTRLLEVPLGRLEEEPQVAAGLLDHLHLYQRLLAVRKDPYSAKQAMEALEVPAPGRTREECEAAMVELLDPARGGSGREKSDLQLVVDSAREGESLVTVARDLRTVAAAFGGRDGREELARAFTFVRSLEPEPAARFLRVVERAQSYDVARKAYDGLYGDGRVESFAAREQALADLVAAEKGLQRNRNSHEAVAYAGAVDALELLSRTMRSDETLPGAVARYGEVVSRAWRVEDGHEAFRVLREDLGAPVAVPVRTREDVFISLLDDRNSAEDAAAAFRALAAGNPSASEFEARRDVLAHLRGGAVGSGPPSRDGRSLAEAARDLEGLVAACVPHGGVQTAEGQRFLAFADVTASFAEASQALTSLEHAPFPADAAERDAVFLTVARAAREARAVRSSRERPTVDSMLDDYWYVVRTAAGADSRPVARQYAQLLVASGGDVAEARLAQAVVRTRLAGPGPAGVPAEQREAWFTGLVRATGSSTEAWEALRWVEAAPDAGEAEQRMQALACVVPMARRFSSAQPLVDAMEICEDLIRRPRSASGQPAQVAGYLAEVTSRLPYAGSASDALARVRASLLEPGASLDVVMEDLRGFSALLDAPRSSFEMITAWPGVRRVPAGVSSEERTQALHTLLATERCSVGDLVDVYQAVAAGVADGPTLLANAGVMATLLKGSGRDAVAFYHAIEVGLKPAATLGEAVDGARRMRYAGMVAEGADRESLDAFLEAVSIPVAGEALAEREEVLTSLWRLCADGKESERGAETLQSYQTLTRTLYPGERLAEVAGLFEEVARAVRRQDLARDVIGRLQSERLQGNFPGVSSRELVERFVQAYAMSGDLESSMAVLHRPPASKEGGVVDGEETVIVGGIRIPKRKSQAVAPEA